MKQKGKKISMAEDSEKMPEIAIVESDVYVNLFALLMLIGVPSLYLTSLQ